MCYKSLQQNRTSQRTRKRNISLTAFWGVLIQVIAFNLIHQPTSTHAQSSSCYLTTNTCIPLSGPGTAPPTCYGASLKFSHTALLWANDSSSLAEVTSRLRTWEGLSSVPECWAVVQPFLCSVYIPKCDSVNKRVEYPSLELCERIREPCKVIKHFTKEWPDFLRCSKPYFKQNCGTGAYDQLSYNTTGRCDAPLVRTDKEGLEGCGLRCDNPLFTEEDHGHAHFFVAVMGSLCLLSSLFTIFTFIIDWENASRYPALILFFVNFCFLCATVGWMAQFATDKARSDIVCRVDGTQRKAEPRSGETASCTVVFVMIYYFTMAGLLWFVMLCYAWHVTFRALGTPRDDLSSKTAYFHLVSWSIPLVLTIVCLAISEIDGDSLSGICFVGYHNHSIRAGFVLVPVACVIIVGLFFLMKGLWTLAGIRKDAPEFVGDKAASKIMETIVRIGIFSALALSVGIITFAIHIYIFIFESSWSKSLDNYLYCRTNKTVSESAGSTTGPTSCSLEQRPSLIAMETNMFAFFFAGIIMSTWSWTKASLQVWDRFLRKLFKQPSSRPVRHRHNMVAEAYDRRQENNRRLSVSFQSTHDDPLAGLNKPPEEDERLMQAPLLTGMKFDMHSLSSNVSRYSQFAHNIPQFKRGGVVRPPSGLIRRHSDSDLASVMSRRLSQGSQQLRSNGQYVYMERDNSSNNGSVAGGWRRRRRRRKKRRKKKSVVQPILGPVLSGMGFGTSKLGANGGVMRRGSESSVLSKASAQGIRMHVENQTYRLGGSMSSLLANDQIPAGGTASGSDLKATRQFMGRTRRHRKLPRLAPLNKHRHRSLSSSRSSMSQFGLGLHGMNAFQNQYQHQQNPYAQLYAGYNEYAQYYASLGYPQMAYPYWQPYPAYPFPPPPPPGSVPGSIPPTPVPPPQTPPHLPHPGATSTPSAGTQPPPSFTGFSPANSTSHPAATSSPESERKRLKGSTSRCSEVTIETQQTEMISMKKLKTTEYETPCLTDDSEEDLNSSQLEDSAEEAENGEDTGDTTGENTGEADVAV